MNAAGVNKLLTDFGLTDYARAYASYKCVCIDAPCSDAVIAVLMATTSYKVEVHEGGISVFIDEQTNIGCPYCGYMTFNIRTVTHQSAVASETSGINLYGQPKVFQTIMCKGCQSYISDKRVIE